MTQDTETNAYNVYNHNTSVENKHFALQSTNILIFSLLFQPIKIAWSYPTK